MRITQQKQRWLMLPALLSCASVFAAPPQGYYDSVDQTNASTLKSSLHQIIDDHQRFPYTSSATDTWDILEVADQDPNNANNVITIYKNETYTKFGGGNSFYNREHSWPKSYGFPKDGSSNYAYTDAHHLFIADSGYNSSRSNKPYAECDVGCDEKITILNNGRGGSNADSNYTTGSFSTGSWETWNGRKGDVARAMMYMAVRYEGGTHGVTGVSEPDLRLTDDRGLIAASNTGANIDVAYMGLKSVLLNWHKNDPVDDFERRHNDAVYSFQGNRNPFVDNPEYVACVFENACSGGSGGGSGSNPPPASNGSVWINEFHYDNSGSDVGEFVEIAGVAGVSLSGYSVVAYNGNGGGAYKTISLSGTIANQSGGVGALSFNASGLQNGGPDGLALVDATGSVLQFISYEGTFTASNGAAAGMQSEDIGVSETTSTSVGFSLQLSGAGAQYDQFYWVSPSQASPGQLNAGQSYTGAPIAVVPWINEFHYDNQGSDRNEFVEVAGSAGTDLSGWSLVAYNGGNGQAYKTVNLSGSIANQQNGFGTRSFTFSGLQNGGPDGIALVDDTGNTVLFISYEGTFTAANGPASGLRSTDIGVSENGSTSRNHSLQLRGTGSQYSDFTWQSARTNTSNGVNANQSF
jgi:endonuclease I